MRVDIFGMWVESDDLKKVASEITSRAAESRNLMVVTPNVDHFLRWQKSSEFRELYGYAEYRLIDGMPILWLARLISKNKSMRITGVDLSLEIISCAVQKKLPVALIGGSELALKLASQNLRLAYPGIQIYLTTSPNAADLSNSEYLNELVTQLSLEPRKIVLLCLGSPKQEKLYFDLNAIAGLSGAFLCVGGTIDFLANLKKRAPQFVQITGFEWLYRFSQDPVRLFRRYFISGVFIFPYLLKAVVRNLSQKAGIRLRNQEF
jgi:N-acetylglucosaminyldiphosphoundecaprenol N-acetyl-beta-D-mannosaminyltransferase